MFKFGRRHDRHEHENEHGHGCGRERMHRGPFGGGGFGPGGGPGRRGGPMGRGRFFDHGDLKLLILALIAERPRHGYELIKEIEDKVSGAYSPSPGVIYPTLTMLEELGYVTVEVTEGNRKLSHITDAGREFLAANDAEVKVIFARMAAAGENSDGARSPQLIRALENFKLALRLKMSSGPLTAAQVEAIAAALDEAVGKIERS